MATWTSFESMDAWKAACRLVVAVHKATAEGEVSRDYAFRDHLRKSALSIPSNIAEGIRAGIAQARATQSHQPGARA